ncbi:MAG TPA: sugar kinase, partial [Burkholderiales bacterium]|nr:sugar kinase [Burkholderiales bacterium]
YITRVGDDEFGRMFLDLWKREGVDTRWVIVDREAPTAAYFVTHGSQGHVFSYLRRHSAASRLQPADVPDLSTAAFVHASGISMAISQSACDAVFAAFERTEGKIAFDSNLRLKLWPLERASEMIGKAAGMAEYFFPSIEDAQQLSGAASAEENLAWAHDLGARIVFLKLGAEGVIVSDGKRRERLPAVKVKAVDATGAGDCFCGAALARLVAGDSIWEAARYANAAAALATTGYGAVDPLPRPEAVRQRLS